MPRFKSGVEVVQFTVTVLDADRRPVPGLTASDFEVLVDGKPRPLAAFAAVTLPDDSAAAASLPLIAPDVQTNQLPTEGRLVIVVIDRSIQDSDRKTAQAIAHAAIDRLGPNDLGAVIYTGIASRKFTQGLTADRERLHASADLTSIGELHAAPATPNLAVAVATRGAWQRVDQLERAVPLASQELGGGCNCGICVIDSLTALARSLTGAMGRQKLLLFIGSDIAIASTVAAQGGYCAAYIYPARDKLTRALAAANVTFHAIDPHGLDPTGAISFRAQSLAVLPDETGGRTLINNNRPEEKIGPIFDESRAYYVLAVARDRAASQGDDRHQIKITTKRNGAIVNARSVYFSADAKAAAARAPNAAAGALNELLAGGDFPLQMNLAPEFADDGSTSVRVLLGVDSSAAGKLDVLIRAYDRLFTPVGTPLKQRLDVSPGVLAGTSSFQWGSTLKLPPGDYEVRAAVATADEKRAASVIGYVEVPDVKKAGLALSGIVVRGAGGPTLNRVFAAGQPTGLTIQIARGAIASGDVSLRYHVTDATGQTITSLDVPSKPSAAARTGIESREFVVRMPGAPGRHVLTVEASDGRHTTRRSVPVTVR